MIDYLSLALGHGLLALALLRLVTRDALDVDPALEARTEKDNAEDHAASVKTRRRQAGAARARKRGESGG